MSYHDHDRSRALGKIRIMRGAKSWFTVLSVLSDVSAVADS
jgi:hypothetical protein